MVKCSFCGTDINKGTGKMFVKRDGTTFFFCSNKCEENLLKLKRQPSKAKWTAAWGASKAAAQKTKAKKDTKTAKKEVKKKKE
ncbi:MAG: 50S ribosomal protein L24e [Candidatus Diapherotrites archaeon]|uniref:Large ribosomal subunit protein eL24 n=1 Tax=Candidatus Iainarchaeum sp. TaxID=3101447 RepID=A0A8T4L461_9ARCH|nr:50S ribosomal protein L24e [Candidatus Diapherotrites archaeon]